MPVNTSPIDFSSLIRDGDLVVCGQATAEPLTLTEALVAQAADLPAFRMMVGPIFSQTFSAACAPNMSFLSYGVIGNARRLSRVGAAPALTVPRRAFRNWKIPVRLTGLNAKVAIAPPSRRTDSSRQ